MARNSRAATSRCWTSRRSWRRPSRRMRPAHPPTPPHPRRQPTAWVNQRNEAGADPRRQAPTWYQSFGLRRWQLGVDRTLRPCGIGPIQAFVSNLDSPSRSDLQEIGHDIHDGPIQAVVSVVLELDGYRQRVNRDSSVDPRELSETLER